MLISRCFVACFAAALYMTACGDSAPPQDTGADSGSDAMADASTSCGAATLPTVITVKQGGVVQFDATAGTTLTATNLPPEWRQLPGASDELRLRASYTAGQATLMLDLSCASGSEQHTVSATVEPITWRALASWQPGTDGPIGREHAQMWIDRSNPDRMWMHGAFLFEPQQFTPSNELWSYDLVGETWTDHTTAQSPYADGGRFVQVPGSDAVLLLGGETGGGIETWRLDYGATPPSWTQLDTSPSSSSHILFGFVFDEPRNRAVSICGVIHCDLATIDPTTGRLTPATANGTPPSGRYGFFSAHDSRNDRFVFFAGAQMPVSPSDPVNPGDDVWSLALDTLTWQQLTPSGQAPPGSRNGCGVFDAKGQRLLVWSGTPDAASNVEGLWALDLDQGGEAWHLLEPAGAKPEERSSCSSVYDAARGRMIVGFGNNIGAIYTDLWALEL